ncbi:MAG: tryptophan 7-halogenase [Bacteroidota bacterium]
MHNNPKKRIVVVGGGLAGWFSVVRFQHLADTLNHRVTILEPEDSKILTTGEACIQRVGNFLRRNGAIPDEKKFYKATNSVLKLGTALKGWKSMEYYSVLDDSASARGYQVNGNLLYQYWLQHLPNMPYDDPFSIDTFCYLNKKTYFDNEGNNMLKAENELPDYMLNDDHNKSYGYHIDTSKTVAYLRDWAVDSGVEVIRNKFVSVKMKDGLIDELVLEDGQTLKGDLFLDCTGVNSFLLNKAYGDEIKTRYLDTLDMELCNSAVYTIRERKDEDMQLLTDAYHELYGWIWDIPLYKHISTGYVYHSDCTDKETIETALFEFINKDKTASFQHISWKPKYLENPFIGNCVALGIGAGFADPLEATTSIILVDQLEIKELVSILDVDITNQKIKQEYNRKAVRNFLSWYNLIEFHYYHSEPKNSDFWKKVFNGKRKKAFEKQQEVFINQEFPKVYIGWAMSESRDQHRKSFYGQFGIRQKNFVSHEYFDRSPGNFKTLMAIKKTIREDILKHGLTHEEFIDFMHS